MHQFRKKIAAALATTALFAVGCNRSASPTSPTPTAAQAAEAVPTAPPDHMIIIFGDGEPDVGPAPLTVEFSTNSPYSNILAPTFYWNFGDGSPPSTEKYPTHTFTKPGTYKVHVTVTDRGADDDDTVEIQVK